MAILNRTFPFIVIMTLLVLATSATPMALADGEHGRERAAEVVPNHYIVHLQDGVDADEVAREYRRQGARPDHVYERVMNGFAGEIPPGLLKRLERDDRVADIEQDWVATIASVTTQKNPPSWGIDRVDQRELPLDSAFSYSEAGKGVRAYVVDSGVRSTHRDFGGRVAAGFDALQGTTTEDCHGHGTHVAGTLAGKDHGVAKEATIVPVRIFDCDGRTSGGVYYAALDWIIDTHPSGTPGVVNLSLTASASSKGDAATAELVTAGLAVAVAAGNDGDDACKRTPAREATVLTVGGTESNDSRASWSNHGTCLDLFAPGRSITSTAHTSDTGTARWSGTSMAAPHVAGAAAVLFGANPTATATEIQDLVLSETTTGVVSDARSGSPNRLLYTDPYLDGDDSSEPEPHQDPVADFSADCTDLSCSLNASGSSDGDGTIVSYEWDFGDGNGATGVEVNHTYANEGTYDVTLTVTDDHDATDSMTRTIEVTEPNETDDGSSDSDVSDDSDESDDSDDSGDTGDSDDTAPLELEGQTSQTRGSWTATVTARTHPAEAGQVITYRWESHRGDTGVGECTTGADGTCGFGSLSLPNREQWVTFTVTEVDGATSSGYPSLTLER
jgi:serine protease